MLYRIENLIQKYLNPDFVSQAVILGIPAWFTFIFTINSEVFSSNHVYDYMENLMPQPLWRQSPGL